MTLLLLVAILLLLLLIIIVFLVDAALLLSLLLHLFGLLLLGDILCLALFFVQRWCRLLFLSTSIHLQDDLTAAHQLSVENGNDMLRT